MPTTLRLDAAKPQDVARAAELLRAGGTVAFPTETVYGLGANALSAEAVARIFTAKQRPSWDPLIVHVADLHSTCSLVELDAELSRRVHTLAEAFWPGPLTLLLPRQPLIPDAVTAGRPLVGVRVPAHPAAQALLQAADRPLAAPSANLFGHTSPTTAQHVLEDLDGRIDAVLDGGATSIGLESTVLDPTGTPMTLYRPGAFSAEQLALQTGVDVAIFQPTSFSTVPSVEGVERAALPAPGVGLRHYAPRARLVLTAGNAEALQSETAAALRTGRRVGVLLPADWTTGCAGCLVEAWGRWEAPDRLAATLFHGLRRLDARGAEIILCPLPAPGGDQMASGLYDAIRDRLQKAARSA